MQLLALLGVGAFCVVSAIVGVRLLLLYRRTGMRPERDGALALLGIGPLGFGLAVLSGQLIGASLDVATAVWAFAAACIAAGSTAACAFTARVFHGASPLARVVTWTAGAVLVACWFVEAFATGFVADQPASPATRVADVVRTAALLWGGVAALHHHALARRRLRIGLAERDITDRFLLWGLGLAAVGVAGLVDTTAKITGLGAWNHPGLMLMNASTGLLAACALYLTFGPAHPLAWLRSAAAD